MALSQNLLACDLGGTKTRLAIYKQKDCLVKIHQKQYLSNKWNSFLSILTDYLNNLPNNISKPNYACIAVAGPVQNGSARITNLDWQINEKSIKDQIGLTNLELINDFNVLVYGIPHLDSNQYVKIQMGNIKSNTNGVIAIIGAGTGLGIAKGIIKKDYIKAFPSEGGHREFSTRSSNEWSLYQWLKDDLNLERISIERVISGTGLGNIARWRLSCSDALDHPLIKTGNSWKNKLSDEDFPAIVAKRAKEGDPIMKEALEIWLSAYGSAAGDIVLQELCTEGLWIAGGTAAKHLNGIRSRTFLDALRNKGRFKQLIKDVPVMSLIDPEAGLFSAACRARMLIK